MRSLVLMARGLILSTEFLTRRTLKTRRELSEFIRDKGTDPLSVAIGAAGALVASKNDPRLLNVRGETECRLNGPHFEASEPPVRRIREHRNNYWEIGVRPGPHASGTATNYLTWVKRAHPGMRTTSFRELTGLLHIIGQIGYPPTMHTDACLG